MIDLRLTISGWNLVLVPRSKLLPSDLTAGFDRNPPEAGTEEVVTGPIPGLSAVVTGAGDLAYTNESGGLRRLSWGCYYLLTGKALLSFPTTTVAHPSNIVHVGRNTSYSMDRDHATLFPFYVEQERWHKGVVPVLQDPNFNMALPKNECLIRTDLGTLIGYLEDALLKQFREEKFLP